MPLFADGDANTKLSRLSVIVKNSWLMLLKTEKRVHAGNLGYDDF